MQRHVHTARPHQDDIQLLERVLDHQRGAWEELLSRYRSLMHRCILKATSRVGAQLCPDDHDEIFCELCMNLLRNDMKKLRAFDPGRGVKLSTWLGMLAVNTAYDCLRRRARYPLLSGHEEQVVQGVSEDPGPLEQILAKERHGLLGQLVERLSARDRDFVRLYFEQELDAELIARSMNISVKTVYTKKHKISARLVRLAEQQRAAA